MKKNRKFIFILISLLMILVSLVSFGFSLRVSAKEEAVMTRQGDTIYFGYYPKTKATDEELSKMSATPDSDGYYTSGSDRFMKVTNADPKVHSETADTNFIPFDDGTQPSPGETYYFKLEQIEWMVLVDDEANDAVMLVSRYYLDTHAWQTNHAGDKCTIEGAPEGTKANSWRYSEMRAWMNDEFLNYAFTEKEQEAMLLFANSHTIDYKSDDSSTIVNDYVAVGNRDDYDTAGNNGRPTDYCIVKGATWCYNKDHIYYYVNATFPTFGSEYVRLYRHDEHNKVASVDNVEAVRPIIYVKRSAAKIIATETQKEEKNNKTLLIVGIICAVVGGVAAIPVMASSSRKYKKQKKENGTEYKLSKKEVARLVPGLITLVCGCVLIFLYISFNGGIGGSKLEPGIYVQQGGGESSGNVVQVGTTAYRLNSDGTFDFTGYYEGPGSAWESHGTWSQSGSTVTFVYHGNPMVQEGHTVRAPIINSTSFGSSQERFTKVG